MDTQELDILLSVVQARIAQLSRQLDSARSRKDLPLYAPIELERKLHEAQREMRDLKKWRGK